MPNLKKPIPIQESPPINHRTVVGRRRRAKTEARIIEAALHVFAEKGPQGAVIDDFIKAAGIARGTFYNYFQSTDELLLATKIWLRDDLIRSIEEALTGITDPVTRFGMGVRLWTKRAASDRAWCGFVSQVQLFGTEELEKPANDLKRAFRAKQIHVPSFEAAMDLAQGTGTSAMQRLLEEPGIKNYENHVAIVILQGLGVAPETIDEIIRRPLPEFSRQQKTLE